MARVSAATTMEEDVGFFCLCSAGSCLPLRFTSVSACCSISSSSREEISPQSLSVEEGGA